MNYPSWTHNKNCNFVDPVNLIFTEIDITDVASKLSARGWQEEWIASNQYMPYEQEPFEKRKQDRQMTRGHLFWRYHIRLWKDHNAIIGNVHFETASLSGGHFPHSFESAEKRVSIDCRETSNWTIEDDATFLDNYKNYPHNNGFATKISR